MPPPASQQADLDERAETVEAAADRAPIEQSTAALFAHRAFVRQAAIALLLVWGASAHAIGRETLLAVSVAVGTVRAFQMPAQQALTPTVLPATLLPLGLAFCSDGSQGAIVAGSALGGFVYVAGATALLPIFARDLLHTGSWGLGLLRAAPAAGAFAVSVALTRWLVSRRAGRVLLSAVAVYDVATIVFGISTSFWLSITVLAISGAADMISVVIRQSLVQLDTPDDMRGRVSAVNSVFIGASNQLGEFESGVSAAWLGPVASVVVGGVGTLFVAAAWFRRLPRRELPPPLQPCQRVAPGLAQQLLEVAETIRVDAGAHRAARFVAVRTVAKAAARRQRRDIVEAGGERRLVDIGAQRPQARCVNNAGTAGQEMQRARRRRVHAAAVVPANDAGVLHGGTDQGVGQRRLAGARRAEQDQRLAAPGDVREGRCRGRVGGIDDDDLDARRHALSQRLDALVAPRRISSGDVGLRQHHDRRHAAGVREREIALQAAQVEVVVEAHDEQRAVDVADDGVAAAVAVAAGDVGRRRHALVDAPLAVGVGSDEHPVAAGQHRARLISLRARRGRTRATRSCSPSWRRTVSRCTAVTLSS